MQMNYYENLWIELPDGIQKMTEDEKKLFLSTDVLHGQIKIVLTSTA